MRKDSSMGKLPVYLSFISTVIALFILLIPFTGDASLMDNGVIITSTVAIVVALLGVASGIWSQVVQFKKDSGKIGEVKADTNEIKPKANEIREDVKEIRNDVCRTVVPGMKAADQAAHDVRLLVEELNFQKRVKEEVSSNINNKDYLLNGIEKIYEVNAGLVNQIRDLQRENYLYRQENEALKRENMSLKDSKASRENTSRHRQDKGLER